MILQLFFKLFLVFSQFELTLTQESRPGKHNIQLPQIFISRRPPFKQHIATPSGPKPSGSVSAAASPIFVNVSCGRYSLNIQLFDKPVKSLSPKCLKNLCMTKIFYHRRAYGVIEFDK